MKKLIFISALLLISIAGTSQNSQQSSNSMSWSSYYESEAQKASNGGDMQRLKYFLKSWEINGYLNDDFHELWAQYWIKQGKPKRAKRELMRAFSQFGCYECKQEADNLHK